MMMAAEVSRVLRIALLDSNPSRPNALVHESRTSLIRGREALHAGLIASNFSHHP